MHKTEIYINAYPRSGTAWLTRLLNDILPQDQYIVRRGHFSLKNGELGTGKFYELGEMGERLNPKQLSLSNITDEKLIFLVRDPRDICVSGAWLWQQPIEQFLDRMVAGDVVRCGRWDEYCNRCQVCLDKLRIREIKSFSISYETLLSPYAAYDLVVNGFSKFEISIGTIEIKEAIERQSFTAIKSRIGNDEQSLRKAGLRKGIAGDWRNHFTDEMNDKIWSEFGWMMERLWYEK